MNWFMRVFAIAIVAVVAGNCMAKEEGEAELNRAMAVLTEQTEDSIQTADISLRICRTYVSEQLKPASVAEVRELIAKHSTGSDADYVAILTAMSAKDEPLRTVPARVVVSGGHLREEFNQDVQVLNGETYVHSTGGGAYVEVCLPGQKRNRQLTLRDLRFPSRPGPKFAFISESDGIVVVGPAQVPAGYPFNERIAVSDAGGGVVKAWGEKSSGEVLREHYYLAHEMFAGGISFPKVSIVVDYDENQLAKYFELNQILSAKFNQEISSNEFNCAGKVGAIVKDLRRGEDSPSATVLAVATDNVVAAMDGLKDGSQMVKEPPAKRSRGGISYFIVANIIGAVLLVFLWKSQKGNTKR